MRAAPKINRTMALSNSTDFRMKYYEAWKSFVLLGQLSSAGIIEQEQIVIDALYYVRDLRTQQAV